MKASRELDALVAEKVMGLRVVAHDWPCRYDLECGGYEAAWSREAAGLLDEPGPVYAIAMESGDIVEPVPFYSNEIADAWEVVEQLRSKGYAFRLEQMGSYWVASFRAMAVIDEDGKDIGSQYFEHYDLQAPLAICLAALAAVGAEVVE